MIDPKIVTELNALFHEALTLKFSKKVYENSFENLNERYKSTVAKIIETCEKADEKDKVIEEISSIIPNILQDKLKAVSSKRKRESLQLDYNTAMVTYIVPVLIYSRNDSCEMIVDRMLIKWNKISKLTLQKAHYEEISGGFKSRLCYITTAVCNSMNKPDDCYELTLLREYRDGYLSSQDKGAEIIEEYYDIAPTIVKRIDDSADSEKIYENIWNTYLKPCVSLIENDKNDECQILYKEMVRSLEAQYIFL